METNTMEPRQQPVVITPEALLAHWQGHRSLTRRVIEAFPEDRLFTHSIGGMRPFSELVMEMLTLAVPGIQGVIKGTWQPMAEATRQLGSPRTRQELLALWDKTTAELDALWPQIPLSRFQENDRFFGQYEGPIYWSIFYVIDNEIHHRAQGYVYLRSLNIAPPPFWERG